MKKKSNYSDLLKHPKWQKMRLKVLEDQKFTCERCDSKEKTLNVHHGYYDKNLKPWEYPIESLHCLCGDCHKYIHELQNQIKHQIRNLSFSEQEELLGYAKGLESHNYPNVNHSIISHEEAKGIAMSWEISVEPVLDVIGPKNKNLGNFINGYSLFEIKKTTIT
ncbi:hypothetical protein KAR91_83015 [Candidatus Pacearchaeota archaeon]|nr:hypothetical protein [Candidatus Pacearchaeota archaeon]